MATQALSPVVLIALSRDRSLAGALIGNDYAVMQVPTGTLVLEQARAARPDVILLDADLPDMSGIDACRLLHRDLRVGGSVPIIILTQDKPTPEQSVTALRAGAWDFVRLPADPQELTLKVQACVQAKRNIDAAIAEGLVDPTTGLHTRPGLARRARELGALLSRTRGALACVVFALEGEAGRGAGTLLTRVTRVSDVVGTLDAAEFAVLAPGTSDAGAVQLAQRVARALQEGSVDGVGVAPGSTLLAGYDAVANFKYSPIDPVALLARARMAIRQGSQELHCPWVRRFDDRSTAQRVSPAGLVLNKGSASL